MRAVVLVALTGCQVFFPLDDHAMPPAADARPPVDMAQPPDDAPECPSTYRALVDGSPILYRMPVGNAMWMQAELECENDSTPNVITHLAVPSTGPEIDALRMLFGPTGRFWVGIGRDASGGVNSFRTLTGVSLPMNSGVWNSGEPNTLSMANIQVAEVTDVGQNRLNDTDATMMHTFICVCDKLPITLFQ